MKSNPQIYHRRSVRLKNYDYSTDGAYFITICTQNRESLFGNIGNGCMILNNAGRMIKTVWDDIPQYYPGIGIDVFQIMPNHVHGIIFVGATPCGCPIGKPCPDDRPGQAQGPAPTKKLSLPDVVHRYKTMTTCEYIRNVKQNQWKPFDGKLWQRNYYEHVLRNDESMQKTREYIVNNPLKWEFDEYNPNNATKWKITCA